MLKDFFLVGIGGFAGSAMRYGISLWVSVLGVHPARYPLATFLVNFIGSLLIGVLIRNLGSGSAWFLVGAVGFCGGFTTFSTFSLETMHMLRSGDFYHAAGYALLSVAVCTAAVFLGMQINVLTITK